MDTLIALLEQLIIRPYMNWKLNRALEEQYETIHDHFTKDGWPLEFFSLCDQVKNEALGFDTSYRLHAGVIDRFPGLSLTTDEKLGWVLAGTVGIQYVYYSISDGVIFESQKKPDADDLRCGDVYLGEL